MITNTRFSNNIGQDQEDDRDNDIAIVGMGCRLPGGSRTPQQFYEQLLGGLDGISKMTDDRWSRSYVDQGYIATDRAGFLDMKEWMHFDKHFFGVLGKEAAALDPQIRLYLSVLWEALEDSHIDPASIRGSNTSVFLGQMFDANHHMLTHDLVTMTPQVKTGRSDSSIRASYCYDFRGQSLSIDTACSSSLVAVLQGIDTILKGESDISICGGVNAFIEPTSSIQFTGAGMLGKAGKCATFDESADGYVRGEGVGVVVLKRLSKAIEDNDNIYCVIKGGSSNLDGNFEKQSQTSPSAAAQQINTQNALKRAGLSPSDIYYVECHGTGTPTGDPLEIESISRVFAGSHSQSNPLRIGSVKKYKTDTNHHNNFVTNGNQAPPVPGYLIPFSSNSQKSIDSYINMIKSNVESYRNKMTFEDFVRYQSQSKTNHPTCKKVIIAKDWESFSSESTLTFDKQQSYISSMAQLNSTPKTSIVMVFCGQGAQWSGMGDRLYQQCPIFRKSVDTVDRLLSHHYQYSIIDRLRKSNDKEIHHPILAQPATFIIQVALVQLYHHFGITPSIVVGHSFGDITAAWCSGILSLEEAVRIVYLRSVAQNETIGSGRMLAVSLSYDKFKERFHQSEYDSIELACYNSAESIVLAGNEDQLKLIDQELKDDNIFSAFLGTPCAFHSSSQIETKEFIFNNLNKIKYETYKPTMPYFSTTTSQQIILSSQLNAQYIYDNLRQPVLFQQTINNIVDFTKNQNNNNNNNQYIYLEIAPHSTLSFYLKSLLQQGSNIQSPLNKKKDEVESIQSCLSQLYFGGVCVDFSNQLPLENNSEWKNRTRYLPRYQWDTEYLLDEQEQYKKIRLGGLSTTLLGHCDSESLNSYQTSIDVNRPSYQYLKGHKVKGKYLFPGTGYIENIINAFPNKDIHIHHLQFIAPFFLKEGAPCQLKSTFSQSSSIEYQATFQYYDDKLGKWIKSAVGRLSINNPINPINDYSSVDKLRQQTFNIATMNTTEVYQKLTRVGLLYGETFKRINKISFNKDGAILSEIECKSRNHFEESNTVLNASVLDCLLHSCIVTFRGEHPRCEVVFDRVEDFHIYSNNIPKHPCDVLFAATGATSASQQKGNEFKGSMDIIDRDGNTVVKCGNVVCISLTKVLAVHHAKHPTKYIKQMIWQPKNAPSTTIVSQLPLAEQDIFGYFESYMKSASTSHRVIRILDFGRNDLITFDLLRKVFVMMESSPGTITDFTTQDGIISVDHLQKDNLFIRFYPEEINTTRSLTDQGFLSTSFDLILSTMEYITENNQMVGEFERLLNPNGQLVIINTTSNNESTLIIDDNMMEPINNIFKDQQLNITHSNYNIQSPDEIVLIGRKPSVEEVNIAKFDNLLFITPSSSSSPSSSSLAATSLIQQSSSMGSVAKKISFFSNDDIMDECKYQSLLESISYDSVDGCNKVGIIYLESLEEMNSSNLELKSMQLIRLHQIIRKEQLPIKLITLIAGQLNHCLRVIPREYGSKSRGETVHFDSVTIILDDNDSCNQVSLEHILQCSNSEYLGESDLKLCQNNILVERIIDAPQLLDVDPKFVITNQQDMKAHFEIDQKYHIRQKNEMLLDDEVEFQVKAASINFKDLMILEGKVDQRLFPIGDIYRPPLGQDCSGIVTRIGSKVTKFKVGDEVYGISAGFASSTVTFEDMIVSKPKELSFAEAASLPLSMGTACLVLFKKANIYPTESILIHSATGGVGLGMLNLLKFKKHTGNIFVTVGSEEKKSYLEKHYGGSFITAILEYDNFTKRVLECTNNEGVNYVINTLDYTRMQDNFKCLSKNGVVIDLSVDQFFQVRDIDMGSLNYDKGYLTYHFSHKQMYINDQIKEYIGSGLEIPPITVFPSHQILQAFDHVRSRKHIGKVVVSYENVQEDLVDPMISQPYKPVERIHYNLEGIGETLLISGQTGIAVESLGYLMKHSSKLRDIIVVTYSSAKFEIQLLVNEIRKIYSHITLHFVQCDIGDYDQLKSSILDLYQRIPTIKPVSVVIHCANTYMTIKADDIDMERHHTAMSGKATGAFNLHNLFVELDWKLNHFHMLSSIAQYIPVDGLSYSIGNAFLDGLARHRRDRGLEATSIDWGSIGQAGKVASDRGVGLVLHSFGLTMMPLSAIYGIFRSSFINKTTPITNLICADVQPKSLVSELPYLEHVYAHYLNISSNNNGNQLDASAGSIDNKILDFISETLSIEKHLLNGDTKLKDYGVDSMTAIQIKGQIEVEFNKPHILNQSHISNGTINSIIESVKKSLK
ncbi:polyketide synthase [Cavenderia fasciculata]|uniref:Polyketide synthase n=1 Tax=Cavenderia fasciculata TaxID=261658 RepID=F4Q2U5_CACFS|nr:polyketide synthase [Cavenderia fasciculata]EGG16721.1 polyketide synthase [Cavenderia fasciculata]|eukprot:XP_004355195.1 polyketide synthase [Cavenderia fasciculata]